MGDVIRVSFEPPVSTRDEPILTKDEIAQCLGYDKRTIERFTREGMPADTFGIRRVYRVSEVLVWFEEAGKGRNREERFARLKEELPMSRRGRIQDPPADTPRRDPIIA